MADYFLRCIDCEHECGDRSYRLRCSCGGLLEAVYAKGGKVDRCQPGIFAFHEFMPFEPTPANVGIEDIDFDGEFFDHTLSEFAGVSIVVKDFTGYPTGTWKDLEGFVSIDRAARCGVRDFVMFSSGNTGLAFVRSASYMGRVRLHLIVPKASEGRLRPLIEEGPYDREFINVIYFNGGNDECAAEAERYARANSFRYEGGFDNIARREGLKLVGLDHCHRGLVRADWYVQAVASGIGLLAFEKAYRDSGLDPIPMLGVQAAACAPMFIAWDDGSRFLEGWHVPPYIESEFVRVLRTRNPSNSYRYVRDALKRTGGALAVAGDDSIFHALRAFCRSPYYRAIYERFGSLPGLEAATALAGLRNAVKAGVIPKGKTVLLNVSGAAKPGDVRPEWIEDLLPVREAVE